MPRHYAISLLLILPLLMAGQSAEVREKLERARRLVASENPAGAIPIYEELLRETPDNLTLVMNLAIAHFKAAHYDEVIPLCEKALKLRPRHVPAWLFLGASHFQAGRLEKAVEPLRKVAEAQPNERNARVMLGEALLMLGRFEEAEEHLHAASGLLPKDPRVWYGLERSYRSLEEKYSAGLERAAPESAYWHALTAGMFFERGQYGPAFRHYRAALARKPDFPGLHTAVAAVYRATDHDDWAVKEEARGRQALDCGEQALACHFEGGRYRDVLRAADASAEALYWKARAARELARRAFSRLAELPPSAQLYELKARYLDEQARYLEAAEQWRKALEAAPDSTTLRQGLAVSLYRGRDLEAALPLLEELVNRSPDSAELNRLYGTVLLEMQRPGEALAALRRAVELAPRSAEAHGALGEALMKSGDAAGAIAHLEAALAADEDGTRHFQLARAYQVTGDSARARRALEKYREMRAEAEARRRELEQESRITAP